MGEQQISVNCSAVLCNKLLLQCNEASGLGRGVQYGRAVYFSVFVFCISAHCNVALHLDFDGSFLTYFDIDNDAQRMMMVMISIDIDNYSSFWQFAQLVVQVVFLGAISH